MKDKLFLAVGAELSRLLGGILNKTEHKIDHIKMTKMKSFKNMDYCLTCNIWFSNYAEHCLPDPIPLDDFNIAMKWRDWAVAEYGLNAFLKELGILCIMCDTFPASDVYAGACQPRHFLIAAALCKLNAGEKQ